MEKILLVPLAVFNILFGKFTWQAPPWLQALFSILNRHRKVALALLLAVLVAVFGYCYYQMQGLNHPQSERSSRTCFLGWKESLLMQWLDLES